MNNSWFFDANFNGVPDDFFDDAIKYFDFPMEDVEPNDDAEDWDAKFRDLEPPPSNVLAGFSSGVSTENGNTTISHDESSQLKQWPGTAETSSSRSIPLHYESSEGKNPYQFRTSSPVSVLESSGSSCSAENPTAFQLKFGIPTKRPRSKRPRPPRRTFPFISTSFVSPKFHPLVASESDSEAYLNEKMSEQAKRRLKKKRNLTLLSCTVEVKQPSSDPPAEARRCAHCQVTKTPQWREGPMGPKTLCNACGVRYRSGRLLPEYRPAASPTFVPTIHSNSHRKVLEMRKKEKPDTTMDPTDTSVPTAPSVPMDTSVPTAPSVPMDPSVPAAPSGPTAPSVPMAPTVPTAPSVPTAPAC